MEIRRNYDAVNEAVMVERRKALEALRIRRASKMELYANSGIKLAAGAAMLLIAYGIVSWLMRDTSDTIIQNTYHTVDPKAVAALEKLSQQPLPSSTEEGAKVTQKFTVFNSVERGAARIVTGWNYSPQDLAKPYEQYCYWTQPIGTRFQSARVDLGYLDGNGELLCYPVENVFDQHKGDCYFRLDF
ncbi:MAG: hypothetical protein QNK18_14855 [Gammaproteobacteria bacterium]|nr:hypothetical protein [Gammaproteobacteria bacterium]